MWLLLIIILIVVALAGGWLKCSFGSSSVTGRGEAVEEPEPVLELTDVQAREIEA